MNEYVWRPTVHLRGRQSDREWVLEQKWECHRVVMTSAGYEREPDRDEWRILPKVRADGTPIAPARVETPAPVSQFKAPEPTFSWLKRITFKGWRA
jgi:hypothetical protein